MDGEFESHEGPVVETPVVDPVVEVQIMESASVPTLTSEDIQALTTADIPSLTTSDISSLG